MAATPPSVTIISKQAWMACSGIVWPSLQQREGTLVPCVQLVSYAQVWALVHVAVTVRTTQPWLSSHCTSTVVFQSAVTPSKAGWALAPVTLRSE